ncbi:MAG: FliM/FliN family flagellar motor switch protein [Isosphaeraceae bacterium]
MSVDDLSQAAVDGPHPLADLPRVSRRQTQLDAALARLDARGPVGQALETIRTGVGGDVEIGPPETLWRASGLSRSGCVVQAVWPRLSARLGVGLETPLAHAIVDRLLGFDREPAEDRLQLTPVEWGILTFVFARALRDLAATPGPLGPWDLTLDRVSADPFDTSALGRIVTVRWPLRLGETHGSLRLWVPETLVARWIAAQAAPAVDIPAGLARSPELAAEWRLQGGTTRLPRGLKTLKPGGVLPLMDTGLTGAQPSPAGRLELTADLAGSLGRVRIPVSPAPAGGGARLTVLGPARHEPTPRESVPVATTTPNPDAPGPGANPLEIPVTLVVELGRVNLTLDRLADLRAGDVVELGRHSREPVELTSAGRLVARGGSSRSTPRSAWGSRMSSYERTHAIQTG